MKNINEELDVLDVITIISFVIGLKNYQETLTQTDIDESLNRVENTLKELVINIDEHLKNQDSKIDLILKRLEELK